MSHLHALGKFTGLGKLTPLKHAHCTYTASLAERVPLTTSSPDVLAMVLLRSNVARELTTSNAPSMPFLSSTCGTACSSPSPIAIGPSPIAHRRHCYTTTVAKDPPASEWAQGGRILAGCVSVVSQAL